MSTRCQVQLVFEGNDWKTGETKTFWENSVVLYHHCDGYPENMIPVLIRAYGSGMAGIVGDYLSYNEDLSGFSVHYYSSLFSSVKAVNYVVAADPKQFEIEPHGCREFLHGDIEYFYRVFISPTKWEIQVFVPDNRKDFWETASIHSLKAISPRMSLKQAAQWVVNTLGQKLMVSPIKKAKQAVSPTNDQPLLKNYMITYEWVDYDGTDSILFETRAKAGAWIEEHKSELLFADLYVMDWKHIVWIRPTVK